MGFKEVKTGYRGSKPQDTVDLSPVCATAWFTWKDGNTNFEDRSCLFVSLDGGMLVIGGKKPIGVTVQDNTAFAPGAQKVALNGLVIVQSGVTETMASGLKASGKTLQHSQKSGQLVSKRTFSSKSKGFTIVDLIPDPDEKVNVKVKVIL